MDRTNAGVHKVVIETCFLIGTHLVTNEQWSRLMDPPAMKRNHPKFPVIMVSFNDVMEFLQRLNEKEDTAAYRLPTDTEWEYACRAGSKDTFCFGNSRSMLDDYCWHENNSKGSIHEVCKKRPNDWGLYDMHGNVGEWCADVWHETYNDAPADQWAWMETSTGEYRRVRRGGSSFVIPDYCTSAARHRHSPDDRLMDVGLKVVKEL